MNVDMYRDSFNLFCDSIEKEHPEVLELACGPGNITKFLLDKCPDFKLLGTDLAPNMIELAKINNPSAEFKIFDSKEILTLDKKYDALVCGFLLPYLTKDEAIKLIQDASHILNPNGVLYISTMEDENSKSGLTKGSSGDEMFMNYHEADYLIEALTKSDFELIQLERVETKNPDGSSVIDLILISRSNN